MPAVDLTLGVTGGYTAPAGNAVNLVLGPPAGGSGTTADATLAITVRVGLSLTAGGGSPMPGRQVRAPWQAATATSGARSRTPWGAAMSAAGPSIRTPWDRQPQAVLGGQPVRAPWQGATVAQGRWTRAPWGVAMPAGYSSRAPWGAAQPANRGAVLPWGRAALLPRAARAPWQSAGPLYRGLLSPWGRALLLPAPNRPFPPGYYPDPRPYRLVDLHFCAPLGPSNLDLVFGVDPCEGALAPPSGGIVTSRSSYVTAHAVSIVRLPDLTPLPVRAFTIAADADSVDWQLQADGGETLLSLLAPASGLPREVRVVADGLTFEFVVDTLRRTRAFGQRTASFTARSASVLLGEPYYPKTAWLNTAPRTAQQLCEEALQFTGVGLDWRVTDWLVPAGAWSFTGTPLAAIKRVADAIGAIVQSPRTGDSIIVAPRYPARPWLWGSTTPDVILPLDVFASEGYERQDQPAYEGVYVSGQAQGVLCLVKRTGTAPAVLLPMVTDPLITATEAAQQRGEALLGPAGPGALMSGSLPVLTGSGEPGVIDVNKLVRVDDPAGAWKGLVRSVRVSFDFASGVMRQDLTLERKL